MPSQRPASLFGKSHRARSRAQPLNRSGKPPGTTVAFPPGGAAQAQLVYGGRPARGVGRKGHRDPPGPKTLRASERDVHRQGQENVLLRNGHVAGRTSMPAQGGPHRSSNPGLGRRRERGPGVVGTLARGGGERPGRKGLSKHTREESPPVISECVCVEDPSVLPYQAESTALTLSPGRLTSEQGNMASMTL